MIIQTKIFDDLKSVYTIIICLTRSLTPEALTIVVESFIKKKKRASETKRRAELKEIEENFLLSSTTTHRQKLLDDGLFMSSSI